MTTIQFSSVKSLLSIFAIIYVLNIRTCHGEGIPQIHSVFVSNVVNPNYHETEELKNLLAFPILYDIRPKWSLISHMGLLANYSLIFSSQPNDVITLRAVDLELESVLYFYDLATSCCKNRTTGASLKGLRKALHITTTPSIIFLAINTKKPEDTHLLPEILDSIKKKLNLVILLQIDKYDSIYRRVASGVKSNFEGTVVQMIFNQVRESRAEEYHLITKASELALFALVAKIYAEMFKPMDVVNDFNYKNIVFLYDAIKPTEEDLSDMSKSMDRLLHSSLDTSANRYSIIFSSEQDTIENVTELSESYSANTFLEMIKSKLNTTSKSATLNPLLKTLQTIPPFSRIIYLVNVEPIRDMGKYKTLPEIVQLVMDKRIEIQVKGFGRLSWYDFLPIVHRTIQSAYNFTRFRIEDKILEPENNFFPEADDK